MVLVVDAGDLGQGFATEQEYTWHYTYDDLGRLTYACSEWDDTTSTCDGDEWEYAYDGAGNITRMVKPDTGITIYTYNGANQVETSCADVNDNQVCDAGETSVTYQYDTYGNLTDDGEYEYIYDAAMQLVELKQSSVTVATSVYNGDGHLIEVTILGETTQYVRDGVQPNNVLAEITSAGTTINLYGLGMIAQKLPNDTVQYLAYDGIRSIRQLVDNQGVVTYAQTFDPYGGVYESVGEGSSDYGFMGLLGLKQSPLLYYNGQWYHTGTGRFISPQHRLPNPYVPIFGMVLMGIGLVVSPRLRKKKWGGALLVLLLVGSVGLVVVACTGETSTATATDTLVSPPTLSGTNTTIPPTAEEPAATATEQPTAVSNTTDIGSLFRDTSGEPISSDDLTGTFFIAGYLSKAYLDDTKNKHWGCDFAVDDDETGPVENTNGIYRHVYPVLEGDVVAVNSFDEDGFFVNKVHGISVIIKTQWNELPTVATNYLKTQSGGYGAALYTLYGHFHLESPLPNVNQHISLNTIIGYQGDTASTDKAHVHLEMRYLPAANSGYQFVRNSSDGVAVGNGTGAEQGTDTENWNDWWGDKGAGGIFIPVDPLEILGWVQ